MQSFFCGIEWMGVERVLEMFRRKIVCAHADELK